jgi:hypothetical protein
VNLVREFDHGQRYDELADADEAAVNWSATAG